MFHWEMGVGWSRPEEEKIKIFITSPLSWGATASAGSAKQVLNWHPG